MCGMAGFITRGRLSPDASPRILDRMLNSLAHRGPDGPGVRLLFEAGVAMGHVRLAINDLGTQASQPQVSGDGNIIATITGELYGFRRIRAELAAQGEEFVSKSDSELVVALYRRHGLDFVHYLRGEFAVALVDLHRGRLVLARDRFGVRPLFFHVGTDMFAWASEAKALLTHPAIPCRLSRAAAVNQLVQVMVPGTTAFESIESVQPGQMVVIHRAGGQFCVRAHHYWDLNFPHQDEWDALEPEAHVEAVRKVVTDALMVRLEADVPIGYYLSGGMDSGALLGLAEALSQTASSAFTIAFNDRAYDESAIAAKVAAHAGVDLTVRHVTDDELYDEHYVRAVWHCERTFYNTLGIAKMQLSATAHEHGFRAVISGEGADELFGGYPAFALDHPVLQPYAADKLFIGAILPSRPH